MSSRHLAVAAWVTTRLPGKWLILFRPDTGTMFNHGNVVTWPIVSGHGLGSLPVPFCYMPRHECSDCVNALDTFPHAMFCQLFESFIDRLNVFLW
ncbi:MAG: hypothetical protein CMJ20_09970 [Phycisphaeraceae bacterium]|nr:hypothetical protein [Phycisphaeraceae bacterium]